MEESKSKGQDPLQNESLNNSNKEIDNSEQETAELEDQEQTQLKAAMLDWKRKGNTQLANACADALGATEENKELNDQDDEQTKEIKAKVERIEAEAELKRIKIEESFSNRPQSNTDEQEETKTKAEESKNINSEFQLFNNTPKEPENLIEEVKAQEFEAQKEKFNNLPNETVPNEKSTYIFPKNTKGIESNPFIQTGNENNIELFKKLTNTKFVLQVVALILIIEIGRIIFLIG